jgi:allantoicase
MTGSGRPHTDDFTRKVDLASRRLGAGVVAANDELFAERENLIMPEPPVFRPLTFGHKGQVYDGWETRRRRTRSRGTRPPRSSRAPAGYHWCLGLLSGVTSPTSSRSPRDGG